MKVKPIKLKRPLTEEELTEIIYEGANVLSTILLLGGMAVKGMIEQKLLPPEEEGLLGIVKEAALRLLVLLQRLEEAVVDHEGEGGEEQGGEEHE